MIPWAKGGSACAIRGCRAKSPARWAAMASPLTGKDRGMFFMPEKDDEVLVAFEQGNFAHPYILGFLWNGADTPPESNLQHRHHQDSERTAAAL